MNERPSVVFFGMGPVALASVQYMDRYADIELVITKPNQRKTSRRSKDQQPSVSQWAQNQNLPVLEVSTAAELEDKLLELHLKSKVGVVVDFGIIITAAVIDFFPLGILNSHFSLLPEWRGADPITFALLSGQEHTGVSIMLIVPALDEGDLLAQKRVKIEDNATTPELTEKLINVSNRLLRTTVPAYLADRLKPYPQDATQLPTYSRKIHKEDGKIDWTQPAWVVERHIRAYMGWPGGFTELNGIHILITKAHVIPGSATPGKAYRSTSGCLVFGTGNGLLVVDRLKPEGKVEMDASSYLHGHGQHIPQLSF